MCLVHNKKLVCILSEFRKYFHQRIHFLMILIHIQQQTDFRFVLNDGPITFIGFDHQPFPAARFGISDPAFFYDADQSGTADDTGFLIRHIPGYRRAWHRSCFFRWYRRRRLFFYLPRSRASNSDRLIIGIFSCFAFCTSGTVSSTAVETTTRSVAVLMPSPF